jgi:hypothetical protein
VNILVVEDSDSQYNLYSDAVDDLNEEFHAGITIDRCLEAEAAIKLLEDGQFHGAIIDLQLANESSQNTATGNKVIQKIYDEFRLPVIVVSGNLDNLLDPEYITRGSFYKAYNRDQKDSVEVINELWEVYKTGVFGIIGGTGLIEKKISEVFWKHLSRDIDAWVPAEGNTEKSLLRYTLNHLLAYLDIAEEGENINVYQNAEFYLKPPVKPHIAAGDILVEKHDSSTTRYLLLSPACDVEVRSVTAEGFNINAGSLILGKIQDVNRATFLANGIIYEADNGKQREAALDTIIKSMNPKILFLPDYKELDSGIVNLGELTTVDPQQYASYERVATVSRDYLKEIQSRFSSYYGRQGQPDLNKKELLKVHKRKLSPP